ncbi:MAG: DUF2249 domain-containing protein [Acidimicrobiales bacterium]
MTATDTGAFEAMLGHHAILEDQVARRVATVRAVVDASGPYEPAVAELVAYVADEVLPHAMAEEHSIYQAAGTLPGLADTVAEMIGEHRQLAGSLEALAVSPIPGDAADLAVSIGALFVAHVAKENELLLPPLQAADTVSLSQLLVQMHRLTEAAQAETTTAEDVSAPDPEAALLGLLIEAAGALADAGEGDKACRLVARAWGALRVPRPDLAVRVTAALHSLVRSVTAEPITLSARMVTGTSAGGETLDVRQQAPAQRHESIFAAYGALGSGEGFLLVNDHDPKPLRYQFEAEHHGEFTWDYLEEGPTVWRVRIGRDAAATASPSVAADSLGAEFELDVRRFPHGQRHESIFAAYGALDGGAGFVLVNDHDPKPLRYQFEAEHHGEFTWDYLEEGPTVWRVRIGRVASLPA